MDEALINEIRAAHAATADAARPEAVARQHARGGWTARERVAALVEAGSFVEYGALARPINPALDGPADGLVTGVGLVEGRPLAVASYDYTVYGGTQSPVNHNKMDRLIELAFDHRWPLVVFAEGGGARAHELSGGRGAGQGGHGGTGTFTGLAKLSGWVPTIAVVPGRAFAGHANIAGLCDIVIATRRATMGIAGPPLVEAALGKKFTPEELGPITLHEEVGGIDVLVEDDAAAIAAVRRYLAFWAPLPSGEPAPDAAAVGALVPESGRRAYDMRRVVAALADADSLFELRPRWGRVAITALGRMGGIAVGFIADDPRFLGGAIDSDGSDKIARFIQLCDAHDFPLVLLVDTPGYMVGPESEATALVRHSARMILALHHRSVPLCTVVVRKAYGLGYYAMGSPPFNPDLLVAWPTAEFGGMGLEGAANILHREEIAAAADSREVRDRHAADLRAENTAILHGARFTLDDVVAPEDTRDRIIAVLRLLPPPPARTAKKHWIDAW